MILVDHDTPLHLFNLARQTGAASGRDAIRQQVFDRDQRYLEQQRTARLELGLQTDRALIDSAIRTAEFARRERLASSIARAEQPSRARMTYERNIARDEARSAETRARTAELRGQTEEARRLREIAGAEIERVSIAERERGAASVEQERIRAGAAVERERISSEAATTQTALRVQEQVAKAADERSTSEERLAGLEALYRSQGRKRGDAPYIAARDAILKGAAIPDRVLAAFGIETPGEATARERERRLSESGSDRSTPQSAAERRYSNVIRRGGYSEIVGFADERERMDPRRPTVQPPLTSTAADARNALATELPTLSIDEIERMSAAFRRGGASEELQEMVDEELAERRRIEQMVEVPMMVEAVVEQFEARLATLRGRGDLSPRSIHSALADAVRAITGGDGRKARQIAEAIHSNPEVAAAVDEILRGAVPSAGVMPVEVEQ